MNKRDVNTFAEKKSYIKKTDNTIRCKITRQKKLSTDPLQHVWEYNRSIYSVVKARKSIHTKESNEDKEKKLAGNCDGWLTWKEKWTIFESKLLSREELKRIGDNCQQTLKMKKNWSWTIEEIKGRTLDIEHYQINGYKATPTVYW